MIGLGPQGLFLLRELSRAGYQVTAVGRRNEIGAHSRYGKKTLISSEEELIARLNEISASNEGRQLCHITSGYYLSHLARNYSKLWKQFDVRPSPHEAVKYLINKMETYLIAERVGIRVLESKLLSNLDIATATTPLIAKWNQDIYLFMKPEFKTVVIKDREQLKRFAERYSGIEGEHITVQRYLGRELDNNISYGGYYENGRCLAGILVQQRNQYPMGFSSYVREYRGDESQRLSEKAESLFEKTGFSGFGEVEFKYDIESGEFFLLEVNPRAWGWIKILKRKYPHLVEIIMNGRSEKGRNNCKWVNIMRNGRALIAEPSFRNLGLFFESLHGSIFDIWDTGDPKPFFYQIVRGIRN